MKIFKKSKDFYICNGIQKDIEFSGLDFYPAFFAYDADKVDIVQHFCQHQHCEYFVI